MKKILGIMSLTILIFLLAFGLKDASGLAASNSNSSSNLSNTVTIASGSDLINAIINAEADYETETIIEITSDVEVSNVVESENIDIVIKPGQNITIKSQEASFAIGSHDLGYTITFNSNIKLNKQSTLTFDTNVILDGSSISANVESSETNDFYAKLYVNDSLTLDKIKLLKKYGVNRVSLGVETINKKLQDVLERRTSKDNVINCINNLKIVGITNINVDLIYAIKGETLEDLNNDLEFLLSLDVPHISTYSLIIEDNTKLKIKGIKNIDKVIDRDMYDLISKTLKNNNYIHYEISNFSYDGFMSKHNLKYWRNLEYYGFGVGASGYIDNIRYTNTRSITNYIDGKTIIDKEIVTLKDKMFYEIMLGFRTSMGIDKIEFKDKYNVSIDRVFNYKSFVEEKVLEEDLKYLRVREEYFYVLDEVTLRFLDTLQTNVSFDIIS